MPLTQVQRQSILDKLQALPEGKRRELMALAKERISKTKATGPEEAAGPRVPVGYKPPRNIYDEEHPERFKPTKSDIIEGGKGDLRTIGEIISPGVTGVPTRFSEVAGDFLNEIVHGRPIEGESGGGLGVSGPGTTPTSSLAVEAPIVKPDAGTRPAPTIGGEGGSSARTLTELFAGVAPVAAVEALVNTPGGALKNPKLAVERARGAFLKHFTDNPIPTIAEMVPLPFVLKGAAKGTRATMRGAVNLTKEIPKIVSAARVSRVITATEGELAELLAKAAVEAEEYATKKVADLKPVDMGYVTAGDLKELSARAGRELSEEAKFPFTKKSTRIEVIDSDLAGLKNQRNVLAKAGKKKNRPQINDLDKKMAQLEAERTAIVNKSFPVAIQKPAPPATRPPVTAGGKIADNATPIALDAAVPEEGPTMFKGGFLRDLFTSVRKRATHPLGRRVVQMLDDVIADHHVISGGWLERLRQIGLHTVDDATAEAVTLELNGVDTGHKVAKGMALQIKPLFGDVAKSIQGLEDIGRGIMVRNTDNSWSAWKPLETFGSPRKLREDIAKVLWDDSQEAFSKARAALGPDASSKQVAEVLNNLHAQGKLSISEQTQQAIDALIAGHWVQSPGEAWGFLARRSYDDQFRFFGHIDARRSAHLPAAFYETDARRIIPEYLYGAARRVAEAKHLGGKGEVLRDVTSKLAGASPDEAKFFRDVAEVFLGDADYNFAMNQPNLKSLYDHYTNFSVASRIGLGFATVPNLTQFAISTVPILGVENWAKGTLRILFDSGYRSQLREAGPVVRETMQKFLREEFGGGEARAVNKLLIPFTGANKLQKYMAAAAMDVAYDDLARAALNATDPKHARALRFFERLRLKPSEINTPQGRARALFRFGAESQLQRSVLDDPILFSQPGWRTMLLFKSFGLRQTKLIKDWVLGELKAGNAAPFLRLGAAGYYGGDLVKDAKEEIRKFLGGRPTYNLEGPLWKEVPERFAELGSLGVFSDLMRFDGVLPDFIFKEAIENAGFAAIPLPLSDITRGLEVATKGAEDIGKRGLVAGGRRAAIRLGQRAGGGVSSAILQRAKSAAQVDNEIRSRQANVQGQINQLYVDGDFQTAIKAALEWNKKFPGHMIKLPDVDQWMKLKIRDQGRKRDLTEDQIRKIQQIMKDYGG